VSGWIGIVGGNFVIAQAAGGPDGGGPQGGNRGGERGVVQTTRGGGRKNRHVIISLNGKTWTFDVAQNLGKDAAMEGSSFTARINNYWADFRIDNGKPTSISDQPNNPAVVVTLRGRGVPVSAPAGPHGETSPGMAPAMP